MNSASCFTHLSPAGRLGPTRKGGYLRDISPEKDRGYRGVFARPISRTALCA